MRVGSVPALTAELSWNSRLWRLLRMGEYWMFLLNHEYVSPGTAKYRCVSLLRHVTVRTYLTSSVVILQTSRTKDMAPSTRSR
jgi:hypothetical protein